MWYNCDIVFLQAKESVDQTEFDDTKKDDPFHNIHDMKAMNGSVNNFTNKAFVLEATDGSSEPNDDTTSGLQLTYL